MHVLVCDLAGVPRGHAALASYRATASLNDPGDAEFTLRATTDLYEWLAPWSGMLVLVNDLGDVAWCGVPVKRRAPIGSAGLEVSAREWAHWLSRVAPLVYDSSTPPFDDYGDYEGVDGVPAGFVVADLMSRIPQDRPGLVPCPLQPPAVDSGGLVSVGDLDLSVGRGSVWDITDPIRDSGVDMWVRTTLEGSAYVPRVVVGSPKLGSLTPIPLWLGSNMLSATLEEDGDAMATRWRVKGSGDDGVEVFYNPGSDIDAAPRLLLDQQKDYADKFVDADDEFAELTLRATRLVQSTSAPARWYTDMELGQVQGLEPGDLVQVTSPALEGDPRLPDSFELTARVQSIEYHPDGVSLTLIEPANDEGPLQKAVTLGALLRDLGGRLSSLGMR